MRVPQLILVVCCFVIPWIAPWIAPGLFRTACDISGISPEASGGMEDMVVVLCWVGAGSAVLLSLWLLLTLVRLALLRGRRIERAVTWDCGFACPSARMQYTASSFAQPITSMFRFILGLRIHARPPSGYFPEHASFEAHSRDTANEYLFSPLFRFVDRVMARMRWLQKGQVQVYVLYVAVTLLILLLVAL